ncbi:conserved exported hypothetical protein [Bosea sp. 62]|uniref:DUF7282 domain-containing protein n=1 Tax=unclassified Bosea (in: a-proteobacteria) TaxID=2653178 RepID=UPI00125AF479|nr:MULTISPECIES: hypothetical protein [unclassified Bosea (in: a-proteobacteria)]CAD5271168.1 conserved exported hypothetical protein [Bosea sp. 21B]CAD5291620.1 conserved exported hypothetical protein [Bosea sp. 46]CAD5300704.1 conserved exported hypothetical protein [Bosea sp. 7B]VVT60733.1 conserved exported hypothetical protein [Bosea sp. EC-HK365B]VXC04189.1 conserved exported hypothetical protein [Bosea sp. 62]
MQKTLIAAAGMAIAVTVFSVAAKADHLNIDVKAASVKDGAIMFPSVRIDKDGYVVIHAVADGKPVLPESIGHTAVKTGTTSNVTVKVPGANAGTDYVAMIHYETNGNATYDFGKASTTVDTPGMKPDNTPYALSFKAN